MPTLLPSSQWRLVAAKLWELMHPRERLLLLMNLAMPAIVKVSMLGSFLVSLRLILWAAQGRIPEQWQLAAGIGVFVVFAVTALIQIGNEKASGAMRQTVVRLIRRILAQHLLPLRERTDKERAPLLKAFQRVEPLFVNRCTQVLNRAIALVSSMLLIGVLLTLVTILVPALGSIMIVGGVGVLLVFRYRISHRATVPPQASDQACKVLKQLTKRLASGTEAPNTVATKYESNTFDQLQSRVQLQQQRFNGKLSILISGAGAVLMAGAFFLAGGGYFEEFDPILLLIFAFALRFMIIQSRAALKKWSQLLREREILNLLRQMLLDKRGVLGTAPLTLEIPTGPTLQEPQVESTSTESIV